MAIILAIEPDRRQAAHVSAIVRHRVGAELILADTTEAALDAIGTRVPDLVLVPALLSPQDDAALNAALRVIAAAAHVRALTIPVFANGVDHEPRVGGLLSRWMRSRPEVSNDGCDPAVFAEQIKEYLREAAAERAAAAEEGAAPIAVRPQMVEQETPDAPEPIAADPFTPFTAHPPIVAEEFAAREPLVEEFTTAPPIAAHDVDETPRVGDDVPHRDADVPRHDAYVPYDDAYLPRHDEYTPQPDSDSFAAIEHVEPIAAAAPVEEVARHEPFVFDPIETAVAEYAPRPAVEPFAAPAAPVIEFAFASEPLFAVDAVDEANGGSDLPVDSDEEIDEDAIVIDLSDEIEEISPDMPAEAVFDGEPMGVYTMPSFDDEPFQIGADFDAEPQARFDAEPAARFDTEPGTRFDARAHARPIAPFEPAIEEFFDDSQIVEEFAAVDVPLPAPAVAVPPAAVVSERIGSWAGEADAPAAVQKHDDGWFVMGLRHVWAWPAIEGVQVEPPAPLVSLEEFSETLETPAPLSQFVEPQPAAARPQPVAAKPAPAAAAKPDHMEWAELVSSLRQDIERRRNQPAAAPAPAPRPHTPAPHVAELPRKRKSTPVQDEWGFFDPEQCGFAALLAKLDEFSDGAEEKDVRQPS